MAIITLSRKAFSGTRELAELVSRRLNYGVVSRDDIIHKLVAYGVPTDRLNRARKRQLGWLPRMVREWMHYVIFVRAALSQEIEGGDLIYLGNNGQQLLAGFPNTLHVGVIVGLDYRVGNLIKLNEYGIDTKTARRLITKIDEKRATWGKTIYNDGRHHPSDYDLVIDPQTATITEVCEAVCAAVEQEEYRTTPESLETIELMTVAAELRARIAMDPTIPDDEVEVVAREGVISVGGSVHFQEDAAAIAELLEAELRP
jgi:cytidylate kinase